MNAESQLWQQKNGIQLALSADIGQYSSLCPIGID
jgi:hypothetical protein